MDQENNTTNRIIPVNVDEEMKNSYLDYAMSVIVSRAIPDVCDGLKPVHRRILYCMQESGYDWNKPFRKSARIVGEILGKYHPHGDTAVYFSMVRMAQPFSINMPLVDGQGNFGSVDGDSPAAMRYTEARLSKVAYKIFEDIEFETTDFVPNYDGSTKEPKVLPSKYPNLLVNGSGGIAVGMATNIPTHNLGEVIDACLLYMENPDVTFEEIMRVIPGPDFPTGGYILRNKGLLDYMKTGRGIVLMRAKTTIETSSNGKQSIIVTEIPYQVNKAKLIEKIAELANNKEIDGITDIRDESDKDGIRVVIELRKDVSADVVLNHLYKNTALQTSFGVNMLALHEGRPDIFNIKSIISIFIDFRKDIVVKRVKFQLKMARIKIHIVAGLVIAVYNIDEVIALIKSSKDTKDAKEKLLQRDWNIFDTYEYLKYASVEFTNHDKTVRLTEEQAQAILDLKLSKLTNLERDKLLSDIKELASEIQRFLDILNSDSEIEKIIKNELIEIKNEFATKRKTEIISYNQDFNEEDLIENETVVITVSKEGYIKSSSIDAYKTQKRGGKGRNGMATKEEDFVKDVFVANTHDTLLFFTSKGKVYQSKVYKIPMGSLASKGKAIVNLLPIEKNEKISTILTYTKNLSLDLNIIFATSSGMVRRNKLKDFVKVNANGKIAIKLDQDEDLIKVALSSDDRDVTLATKFGKCVRFPVSDLRTFVGRNSHGVTGIKLIGDDRVISMAIINHDNSSHQEREILLQKMKDESISEDEMNEIKSKQDIILTVTENGFGKKTSSFEYRTTSRGGVGIKNIDQNEKTGVSVGVFSVKDDDDVVLITDKGKMIRFSVKDIRTTSRVTQGVILFRIDQDEKVVSAVTVEDQDTDEKAKEIADFKEYDQSSNDFDENAESNGFENSDVEDELLNEDDLEENIKNSEIDFEDFENNSDDEK